MSAIKRADAGQAAAGLFARTSATGGLARRAADAREPDAGARLRVGVELTEEQVAFLRALSRPARTGQPRTLGSKFVATGVMAAAIELLEQAEPDMHGVAAGDLEAMRERARTALLHAAIAATTEANET